MFSETILWFVLLLSFPLSLNALVPILKPLYWLAGERFVFSIAGAETRRISLGVTDEMGIYEVSLLLRNCTGLAVNYSFKRIARGFPEVTVNVGEKVELFTMAWLVKKFGWSPRNAYICNKSLRDSFGVYLPFWFLGVLPFISASYFLIWDRNLLFDIVGLFGIGT